MFLLKRLVLLSLSFLLLFPPSHIAVLSLQLNIHLPLTRVNNSWAFDKCPYNSALEANLALRRGSDTEQINFFSHHTPHVTLFLSEFNIPEGVNESVVLEEIVYQIQEVVSNHSIPWCTIQWPNMDSKNDNHDLVLAGPYSMVSVPKTVALSQLSDQIVMAMNPYIQRPQVIPSWVYTLPLVQRWRKIYLITKFGSPNVFDQYEPHVTVGYDEIAAPASRRDVLLEQQQQQEAQRLPCRACITHVAISKVGMGGSVLQDGLIGLIPLLDPAVTSS